MYDSQTGPGIVYYFSPTGSAVILENLGEVNMGDASTLQDFLEYGKTNYPAERYMLFAIDHGGGFYGACIDVTSGNDLLYMDEFQSAIEGAGGIDLMGFPGCCTMGAIDLTEIGSLVDSYDELCTFMLDNIDELGAVIEQTRVNAWYMGGGYEAWPEIDFYDFLLLYQAVEDDPVIQEKLQQTMDLFDNVIINEGHGIGHGDRAQSGFHPGKRTLRMFYMGRKF